MHIKCRFSQGSRTASFELNEGYFRFPFVTIKRHDYLDDIPDLTEEQKILFGKLKEINVSRHFIFKHVTFEKQYVYVELDFPWSDKRAKQVRTMIEESWPEFFRQAV